MLIVDIDPEPRYIARAFDDLAGGIRSLRVPLEQAVKQVFSPSFVENFSVGGRPGWKPLAQVTQVDRSRQGYGATGPILVRTGKGRRVAGQKNIWDIQGGYLTGNASAEVTLSNVMNTQAPYIGVHQIGTDKIPQRAWAVLQPNDIDEAELVFDAYIAMRQARAGLGV